MLDVTCGEDGNLDVTSNHLDVIPVNYALLNDGEGGEEINKRPEKFGCPVGQGSYHRDPRLLLLRYPTRIANSVILEQGNQACIQY